MSSSSLSRCKLSSLHPPLIPPPTISAGLHRPLPDAGMDLGPSSASRQRTGARRPQLAVLAVRHSLSSLLTTHAHRCPCPFGWTLGEGARGRKYPMHCLIVVIVVVHHPSSPSSVSVVNHPLSTVASSPVQLHRLIHHKGINTWQIIAHRGGWGGWRSYCIIGTWAQLADVSRFGDFF